MQAKESFDFVQNAKEILIDGIGVLYLGKLVWDLERQKQVSQLRMVAAYALFGLILYNNLPWIVGLFKK